MSFALIQRDLRIPLLAGGFAVLGAALVLGPSMMGSTKILAGLLGAFGLVAGAYVSGNVRLFCLWGAMLTLPFDLSKRFGPVMAKMGGETAFRVEMSDPFWLVLLAFLLRDIWQERLPGLRVPRITFAWMAIMAMGAVAAVLGTWRTSAAHETFRMFKVMLLFLTLCNELVRPGRVLHCAAALTLGLLVQACVGVGQYWTRAHLGLEMLGETGAGTIDQLMSDSVRTSRAFRAGAFLTHPNIFGAFLAALLPMTVAFFLLKVNRVAQAFFFAGSVLGMAALLATQSRSGWVSFAVSFLVLLVVMSLHPELRKRSILTGGIAVCGLLTVSLIFIGPITRRLFESKDVAMRGRMEWVGDAKRTIAARPYLGWGLNSYVFAVPPFTRYGARLAKDRYTGGGTAPPGWWHPPVHNIYLLWWAETGAVGLALHLAVIGGLLGTSLRNLRVKNEVLFSANAAALSGILAFLADGFFSPSLRANAILRVFWVLAAIIMAVKYWRLGQRDGEEPA
jgi:putative inorganic carbon (hco3(-)) transporter